MASCGIILHATLVCGALSLAVAAPALGQNAPAAATPGQVDDQRLLDAGKADGNWITFGRDYTNRRFAPLTQIDRASVARLTPAWVYQLGTVGSTQTEPLVVDGTMFVSLPGNDVAAVNAATGEEIWHYHHKMRGALPRAASNRGVAVAYGQVYEATDDARVVALDQATGKIVWDKVVPPYDASALVPAGAKKPDVPFVMRAPPLVYGGQVIVGATGFEANELDDKAIQASLAAGHDVGTDWINANLGRRGFVASLSAAGGQESWRWYSTKEDGWEGDYVTTTPDGMNLNRDIAAEKTAAALYKNAWAAGSTSIWMTPAYDPSDGTIFVGTGNPAPGDVDLIRPGDNLYSNGIAALDGNNGKLRWFFQEDPHGQFDATGQAVLIDVPSGGQAHKAVLNCGKSGWCFVIDRTSGALLFRTDEVVPHENTFDQPTPEGIDVAPGGGGGVSVSPVSYDPASGFVYVAAMHRPAVEKSEAIANVPGGPALSAVASKPLPAAQNYGTLTALDLKHAGHKVWQVKTRQPLVGGTLATQGGLVFIGEANGHFDAYDSATGRLLWSFQTGANVGAPPMSYAVNGRQYVAVATGAATGPNGLRPGGAVFAFALPAP